MDCAECQRMILIALYAPSDPKEIDQIRKITNPHLLTCESCRAWFLNDVPRIIEKLKQERAK